MRQYETYGCFPFPALANLYCPMWFLVGVCCGCRYPHAQMLYTSFKPISNLHSEFFNATVDHVKALGRSWTEPKQEPHLKVPERVARKSLRFSVKLSGPRDAFRCRSRQRGFLYGARDTRRSGSPSGMQAFTAATPELVTTPALSPKAEAPQRQNDRPQNTASMLAGSCYINVTIIRVRTPPL